MTIKPTITALQFHLLQIVCLILCSFNGYASDLNTWISTIENKNSSQQSKFDGYTQIIDYYKNTNTDSALYYAMELEDFAEQTNRLDYRAHAHSNLANIYMQKGDYSSFLDQAYTAIGYYEEGQDLEGIIKMYGLIGKMHASKGELTEAYAIYEKGLALVANHPDKTIQIGMLVGLGNAAYIEAKYEEAGIHFYKCLQIIDESDSVNPETKATVYTNLGNIKGAEGNFQECIEYYKQSLSIYDSIHDKFGMSLTAFNIGDTYLTDLKMADSAFYYFSLNLLLGKDLQNYEEIYYAYFGLTNYAIFVKDFEQAVEFQRLKFAYKDSMQQLRYAREVVELEQIYQNEQNEKALQIAELKVAESEAIQKRDSIIIRNLWIGASLLLVVLLFFYVLYKKVSKANRVIQEQSIRISENSASIDKALHQKEILLKEVHHRVKNNLQIIASLLNLQIYKIESDEARKAIEESKNRVQAIALMHKGLYQNDNFSQVDIGAYVNELVDNQRTVSLVSNESILFNLEVDAILFGIDDAVPLGLIISELISNSVKHAFQVETSRPTIGIRIAQEGDRITFIYRDNGIGLPKEFNLSNVNSLGFEIITSLVEQIKGTINITSFSPPVFEIKFRKGG